MNKLDEYNDFELIIVYKSTFHDNNFPIWQMVARTKKNINRQMLTKWYKEKVKYIKEKPVNLNRRMMENNTMVKWTKDKQWFTNYTEN